MSVDVFALDVDSGAQTRQIPVEISSLEFLFKEKVQKPKLIRRFEFSRDYSITQDSSYTTNKSQNITICIENLISQRSGVPQETLLDPILLPTLKNPAGSNVQRTSNSSIVRQGCLSSPTLFAKSIFTVKIERDIDEREKRVNLGPFHVKKSPGTHPGVARPPHRKHNPKRDSPH
jgi:hypothetical protein